MPRFHFHSIALAVEVGALAFLVLGTITAPATAALKLGHEGDYSFGALGWCVSGGDCTASFGYDLKGMLDGAKTVLGEDSLNTLTKVLIVIPISAFLTLVSLLLTFIAHFVDALTYSGGFWIGMTVLGVFTFAASTIACVISFLLFYPHVDWPCWCLIPAAVLNMVASVMFGLAWRLLPDLESDDDMEVGDQEKTTLRDDMSYADDTSLTFNPPPVRTQLDVYNTASDLASSAKKSEAGENANELSEGASLESQRSSTQPFVTATAHENSSSTDPRLPDVTNPYLDSANSHTVDSRLTMDEQSHLRTGSANSSDSNFTSISQRGINPRYYAGAPNKPNMYMMNAQNVPPQQRYGQGPPMGYPIGPQGPMGPGGQHRGPPLRNNNYQNVPMPNQPYNRGAYMQKPKPYMAMNGGRPQGGMPPPQNPYGYYGQPAPRGQPQMNGYPNSGGYKSRQRPNLPSASQTREGPYGMY